MPNGVETIIKDIALCAEYNPKNMTNQNLVTILQLRTTKDWKYINQYLSSDDHRSKSSHLKLLVICENSMRIPAHIQPKVLIA